VALRELHELAGDVVDSRDVIRVDRVAHPPERVRDDGGPE